MSEFFSRNTRAVMILPKDCLMEIFSHCDEVELARMRCVCHTFKNIVDKQEYPLQTSLVDTCRAIFVAQESQYVRKMMIRFLMRAKKGYQEGCLVRRVKRWLSHKKNVSFGKVVHKFSKTIEKGSVIYDHIHRKYDICMEKRSLDLFQTIQAYCLTNT